jgi:hypothetical protein
MTRSLPGLEVDHLLLTRFNIWTSFSSDNVRLSLEYLGYRLMLFERYCFPSIIGQMCGSFRWLVFFDSETPVAVKRRVEGYRSVCRLLFPVYLSEEEGQRFDSHVWPFIRRYDIASRRYLLTTRLDSDDALAKHFMQTVQASVNEGDEFINIPRGYRYVEAVNKLYELEHHSNAFSSRLEDREKGEPVTVLGTDHMMLHRIGRVRQVFCAPGWTIVVHGRNVSNRYEGSERRIQRARLQKLFAIPGAIAAPPESRAAIAGENVLRRLRASVLTPSARLALGVVRRLGRLAARPEPKAVMGAK